MNRKKRTFLKSAVLGLTAIATSMTIGMSTACSTSDGGSSSDKEDDKTTTKIDEQTIKNGNFEFYSDNKGLYPISNPDNWTRGYNGTSSSSMSGVINTSKERWDYITDPDLPQTLEDNDDLDSDDDDKKDYNGALTDDLPYKNTHDATDTSSESSDESAAHAKDYIENPYTHSYRYDEDGKILDSKGNEVVTYEGDDGKLYFKDEEDKGHLLETSVLMIHNYRRNDFHGAETYYTSSTTVTLEANTAAEISLWVKTSELYFSGANTQRKKVDFDRGAYIKVNTQVGGNDLDAFTIKNINTEKLNPVVTKTVGDQEVIDYENWENNGWVQYTVYVAASSFATTSVNIQLGLGENEAGTVEGYAFFDDVTIKKYNSIAAMEEKTGFSEKIHESEGEDTRDANVSYPLSPDAQNEFRVDVEKYKTDGEDGGVTDQEYKNNFEDRYFFIDFANSAFKSSEPVALSPSSVKGGLTVEETNTGKYVCAEKTADNTYQTTSGLGGISDSNDKLYIPTGLKNNGIRIDKDIIATTLVGSGDDWSFASASNINTEYDEVLTDALKTATKLPGAGANTDALVMLSAYGAAYEAHITDNTNFKLNDGEYMLVSFWIKTSDMKGKTAATVTVKGLGDDDKDVTSSFSVDTTTLSEVTIGEGDDKIPNAYNGWARCFIRVSNTSKDTNSPKSFEIVVNFGNTSIRSTSRQSYKAGWVALTNISVMSLDEDVYGYTSGSSQTATIAFNETVEKTSHQFDTEQGEKNEIKKDLATPSSYTGVNGNSSFINSSTDITLDGYHDTNKNDYAGLLSKEHFENENYKDCTWYSILHTIEQSNLAAHDNNLWNAVFGNRTVQPLLIVNTVREFGQADGQIYNYGYIGKSASVSANSYKAVSVRVKASAGAVASVYLVEDKSGGKVLSYSTPKYNFWYDADGNILKDENEDEIAYRLRKDGLYENGDGKLYANFYNLTRQYDLSFEHEKFFDADGNKVNFEDLVKGEIYYADANKTAYAPHYLVAGGKDNNKVYLYSGNGVDGNATYYYVEDGKANKSKLVYGIDTTGETVKMRYENGVNSSTPYQFTIDTVEHPEYIGKWVTVTFYIHTGAEAKSYKLELWSGKRDAESSYTEGDYDQDSYVIFDYSDLASSLNQSTFDDNVAYYADGIIAEYKKAIINGAPDAELKDNDANISDLEKLAEENSVNVDKLYDYEAAYYTFSLFDSEAFIPFNGEINTDDTGYSFDYTESKESLAFLKVVDNGLPYGETDATKAETFYMSSFIDYSVIDKDVDIIGEPTAPGTSDSDTDSNSGSGSNVNVWLLASSIVLLAAMLIAIAALFIKDFVKKHTGRKSSGKNSYNFNKNKRYVKKYVKANGEAPVIEEGSFDESLMTDKPADSATVAETEEMTTEEKVEETPAVEEPAVEEAPAESEEATPSEDDGKDE